jgi:hypothetical protein
MDIGEIAERFIRAAKIDLNSGGEAGPRRLKAMALPYLHDQADKNGWGTERLAEERKEFWERLTSRPTAADISEADETRSWLTSVPDESQRACLLAWADAAAGFGTFKDWCFRRGIHPQTGTRRKDRALEHILAVLVRRISQHCEMGWEPVLIDTPEITDIDAILGKRASDKLRSFAWAADDAFLPFLSDAKNDFSWAQKRNEIRRQREQQRRKQAA